MVRLERERTGGAAPAGNKQLEIYTRERVIIEDAQAYQRCVAA